MASRQGPSALRRGFTLLELILVLAVLVAAMAIAIPVVIGPMEGQRLRKAADQVRAAFNRARVAAMRTGQTHLFHFQPGTNLYVIEALQSSEDLLEASPAVMAAWSSQMAGGNSTTSVTTPIIETGAVSPEDRIAGGLSKPQELSENTMFMSVANLGDLRSARILQELQMSGAGTSGPLSEPILFYADGTSSTTQVVLANLQEQFVVIQLRGLTGLAQVSELLTPDEVPQP